MNEFDDSTMTQQEAEAWALRQLQLKVEAQKLSEPIRCRPKIQQSEDGIHWEEARPLSAPLLQRIKNAWLVILGKREVY